MKFLKKPILVMLLISHSFAAYSKENLFDIIKSSDTTVTEKAARAKALLTEDDFDSPAALAAFDAEGNTPLHVAIERNQLAVVDILLRHGASPYLTTRDTQVRAMTLVPGLTTRILEMETAVEPDRQVLVLNPSRNVRRSLFLTEEGLVPTFNVERFREDIRIRTQEFFSRYEFDEDNEMAREFAANRNANARHWGRGLNAMGRTITNVLTEMPHLRRPL